MDYELYFNGKCTNTQENVEINSLTFSYSNMKDKMFCFYSKDQKLSNEDPVLIGNITKSLGKKVKIYFKYYFICNFCYVCVMFLV